MDSLLQHLVSMVQSQTFPHKEEFIDAVNAEKCTVRRSDTSETTVPHLLAIYQRRHTHLAKMRSRHAKALANDVAWLCTNLKTVPEALWIEIWIVDVDRPYQLDFFLDGHTKIVLGCMKTVSKLEVTREEWNRLWSTDVADS